MKPKRIYMLYYNYNHNFGDVLIYYTAKEKFQKKGYDVYYTLAHRPCNEILPEASQFDFLLFPGGGLIERDVFNVIKYFKDDHHMLQVPYGVMGLSVGEFEHEEYHDNFSYYLNNSSFFYTRDTFTAEYFNRIAVSDFAKYSGDTVFSYNGFHNFKHIERQYIGINVHKLPYIDLTGDFDWVMMDKIIEEQEITVLVPDEHNLHIRNNLNSVKLSDKFTEAYNMSSDYEKTQIILGEIAKCKILVATRFHVILAAAAIGGVIPIPIKYCPKCTRLAIQLGIEELSISINELDKIHDKIKYAKENKNYLLNKISLNVDKMKRRTDTMFDEIFSKLNEILS